MSGIKDWMTEAAIEINEVDAQCHCSVMSEDMARDIIAKHCPFKPGIAYMPVPRCETCAHWTRDGITDPTRGACAKIYHVTQIDFGCVQWKEKV